MDEMRKVAIITGASGGVGSGMVRVFAREGYNLLIACNRNMENTQNLAKEVVEKHGIRCEIFQGDLGEISVLEELVNDAIEKYGHIDALISNAGLGYEKYIRCAKIEELDLVYKVNFRANVCLAKLVAEKMIQLGTKGSIVFTSSIKAMSRYQPIDAIYGGLKAGLSRVAISMAREYCKYGIRVNCVLPGNVPTEDMAGKDVSAWVAQIPLGRLGTGEDVGEAAEFLCSDRASFITGIDIQIDGGSHCGNNSLDPREDVAGMEGTGPVIRLCE